MRSMVEGLSSCEDPSVSFAATSPRNPGEDEIKKGRAVRCRAAPDFSLIRV